ncbi:XRE family transcriptional regulator [Niabella ginsenosidivorans]|uniref:XRE family transcriptional regulator n=1 Tax=Niabella ginsenosidivorans TaxID=1176587 RepID=A0A1A9I0X8_9BACT|nr:mobile mystery protein A [Niabella ginsenosidivorans]ANH80214.1 XRE family transcriptional regulator [Niabella ginsenosidivorans]
MKKNHLQRQQLNNKLQFFEPLKNVVAPPTGWIKAIRLALGISLEQLGRKLSITKQGAMDVEKREAEGSITLKTLKEAANALDMQLVYGLVPKDGSLDTLIDRKARALARKIVLLADNTMILEDQGNSQQRLEKAIEEKAEELKIKMPKMLWD